MKNIIQKFDVNLEGRDIVVGDIHCCFNTLMDELENVDFDLRKDRLFACGDLIDRGPHSLKVLELLNESWFFSCLGNHEEMMIKYIEKMSRSAYEPWIANGGDWAFDPKTNPLMGEKFSNFVLDIKKNHLPLALEVSTKNGKKVGIVHAQPPYSLVWNEDNLISFKDECLWSRELIKQMLAEDEIVEGIDFVYCGHTPIRKPITKNNIRWIDLGCFGTGKLHIERIDEL